jgi:hypothetical protein
MEMRKDVKNAIEPNKVFLLKTFGLLKYEPKIEALLTYKRISYNNG